MVIALESSWTIESCYFDCWSCFRGRFSSLAVLRIVIAKSIRTYEFFRSNPRSSTMPTLCYSVYAIRRQILAQHIPLSLTIGPSCYSAHLSTDPNPPRPHPRIGHRDLYECSSARNFWELVGWLLAISKMSLYHYYRGAQCRFSTCSAWCDACRCANFEFSASSTCDTGQHYLIHRNPSSLPNWSVLQSEGFSRPSLLSCYFSTASGCYSQLPALRSTLSARSATRPESHWFHQFSTYVFQAFSMRPIASSSVHSPPRACLYSLCWFGNICWESRTFRVGHWVIAWGWARLLLVEHLKWWRMKWHSTRQHAHICLYNPASML